MSTARDLIKGSLRLIGAIAHNETPSAAELSDGLSSLNDMVDSWSTDGHLIYHKTREEFSLTIGDGEYTIGNGGDFDTDRPQVILEVGAKETSDDVEIPIRIFNVQEWAGIGLKSTQSTLVQGIYYEPEYPLGKIYVWPIPSAASRIVLYSLKPLTSFASVNTDVILPPGYARALKYNLAVEMAPEYGKTPSELVLSIANESKASIKRVNTSGVLMKSGVSELMKRTTFNYLTGE